MIQAPRTLQSFLANEWLDGFALPEDVGHIMIGDITLDSREVRRGSLFIALPGQATDGRRYLDDARKNGAVLLMLDGAESQWNAERNELVLRDLPRFLGAMASAFFDHPSQNLEVIGITGTNGKSTCAHLCAEALTSLGKPCAMMGTLGFGIHGKVQPSRLTTHNVIDNHRYLAELREAGAQCVAMEVSSHGLDQNRLDGIAIDIAIFTNLTQDHLDYHHTMEAYGAAKARLFAMPNLRIAVLNAEDEFTAELQQILAQHNPQATTYTYGVGAGDLQPRDLVLDDRGIQFVFVEPEQFLHMHAQLIGLVNVPNLLTVIGVCRAMGFSLADIQGVLANMSSPRGRMQRIAVANKATVVVDYAHTPDALQRALESIRVHCRGEIWVVFGCGGDRDREKRPIMGSIAEEFADNVVLTDDNPRSEEPAAICADISARMTEQPLVIHQREAAIAHCIEGAQADDWVLVAGKGHETTQTIGDQVFAMDDAVMVNRALGVIS